MDARGFPTSLREFQTVFPDDAACAKYLERIRWPSGFVCPDCNATGEPYRFPTRSSVVLRCRRCKSNASLTAGTVMQSTHSPLSVWFWGAYLVTTQTPGQSALQFQRQLGLSRYETAFQILHKLRSGMVRPERDGIGGEYPVEVDECIIGGPSHGEAHWINRKARVIGAVEVRPRQESQTIIASGAPLKRLVYAGRLRLRVMDIRGEGSAYTNFIVENIAKSSNVKTDGLQVYRRIKALGYGHDPLDMHGDPGKAERHLPMIHLVFSNLKTWILGTHHGAISAKHLQAYLNEYVFRFNRRFYPMTAFNSVLGLAARSISPTYEDLYSGEWEHPGL